MKAVLTVLRGPRRGETREIDATSMTLGRGEEADWQVAADRLLSRVHCRIAFRAGGYDITDLSTNGVVLNGAAKPLGQGTTARLASGDRIALGPVEIMVRLVPPSAEDDPFLAAILDGEAAVGAKAAPPRQRAAPSSPAIPWDTVGALPPLAGAPMQGAALPPAAPAHVSPASIPDDWLDDPLPAPPPSAAGLQAAWSSLVAEVWSLARAGAALDPELAADPIATAPTAEAAGEALRAMDGAHRRRLFHTLTRMLTQAASGRGMP